MSAHRQSETLQISNLSRRRITAKCDGGRMTYHAGAVLLQEIDKRCGQTGRPAGCFTDCSEPIRVESDLKPLPAQRIFGLCLGNEDLNNLDNLRENPAVAVRCGSPIATAFGFGP